MRLPSLYGNERLKGALAPLTRDSFPTAVVLDGPRGSGKRTAARDLAGALLCQSAGPPCGTCPACVRLAAGSHPDYLFFEPESGDIKVDDVRAIRARSFIKPSESALQVFVLGGAGRMNPQAQNALLKVLEEPRNTVFVLLCENEEVLLPTVRSRSVVFRMEPLPEDRLRSLLEGQFPSEPKERLAEALAASGGFLGQAAEFLRGEQSKPHAAALSVLSALDKGELAILEGCMEAGKLTREEYGLFCDQCCVYLSRRMRQSPDARLLSVFEYLRRQRGLVAGNGSVLALSGALAAYCGQLYNR